MRRIFSVLDDKHRVCLSAVRSEYEWTEESPLIALGSNGKLILQPLPEHADPSDAVFLDAKKNRFTLPIRWVRANELTPGDEILIILHEYPLVEMYAGSRVELITPDQSVANIGLTDEDVLDVLDYLHEIACGIRDTISWSESRNISSRESYEVRDVIEGYLEIGRIGQVMAKLQLGREDNEYLATKLAKEQTPFPREGGAKSRAYRK